MADPTDTTDTGDAKSVVGNGLKVALIAGGILGAGFLFWRLAYGDGESEEKEEDAPTASAAAVAPIATCSCGGHAPAPAPLDASTVVRVGDRVLTLGELQAEISRRMLRAA